MKLKYLSLTEGEFKRKVKELYKILESCTLCGHNCGTNRLEGEKGNCNSGKKIKVNSASPHFGEEPCLVGNNGSGTIFLSHCSLSCVYCQLRLIYL